jgi:hypothetical protein
MDTDTPTPTLTLTPSASLTPSATYTATLRVGAVGPDLGGYSYRVEYSASVADILIFVQLNILIGIGFISLWRNMKASRL